MPLSLASDQHIPTKLNTLSSRLRSQRRHHGTDTAGTGARHRAGARTLPARRHPARHQPAQVRRGGRAIPPHRCLVSRAPPLLHLSFALTPLCVASHTDIHCRNVATPQLLPAIYGHEGAGTVEQVSSDYKGPAQGRRLGAG
ncbi:hypothetical protein L1887_48214 [Cichorium endivia]|nr:hypothetical protein L1887_48214 [Cichorium endivia]